MQYIRKEIIYLYWWCVNVLQTKPCWVRMLSAQVCKEISCEIYRHKICLSHIWIKVTLSRQETLNTEGQESEIIMGTIHYPTTF